MKQVNFTHSGGFPLEQETLERLQTAYRSELFGALKAHLSIEKDKNYIIAHATDKTRGWAVIHEPTQTGEGVLYSIKLGTSTNYLKTIKTTTNLIYGDGNPQTAYTDYEAEYVGAAGDPVINDNEAVNYYDLKDFVIVKNLKSIEEILKSVGDNIDAIKANVNVVEGNIRSIETNINTIKQSYLPIDGSKAMQGDLNLGSHNLYLNNLNAANSNDYLLAVNNQNQVVKSSTLLESLINRITILEDRPASTVPIGMIAIWGKPAPFPDGWEEYVPLQGRMPVGLNKNDSAFGTLLGSGGNKDKTLSINEIPSHTHSYYKAITGRGYETKSDDSPLGSNVADTTGSVGGGQSFSIMNPYRVVHFIEFTGNASDITAPTSPTNLKVSNIGTKSLKLNWTASTDNVGVINYLVYKDNSNSPLAELGKDVLTYDVTGLSVNTPYSFQVRAKDAAGNLSVPTTVSTATLTADSTPPTLPSFFHCVHNGQGYILLEWAQSQDDDSPIDYELSRSAFGSLFTVLKKNPNTYYSEQVSSNGTYTYRLRAIDPSGNASGYKEASVTISSL